MGVAAKLFGPFTWRFLCGLAVLVDDSIAYYQRSGDIKRVLSIKDRVKELMFSFGDIIPCIYCRQSYVEFTNPERPECGGTDICHQLDREDGMKHLVYNLKCRVNLKLRDGELLECQTLKGVARKKAIKAVNKKWDEYRVSYDQVVENYPHPVTKDFLDDYFMMLVYVMCDWRSEQDRDIHRLLELVLELYGLSNLEKRQRVGVALKEALDDAENLWTLERMGGLRNRLEVVIGMQQDLYESFDWDTDQIPNDVETLTRDCRKYAVVDCVK